MKKVLFATTALVASAGFAAAEVSLSGSAEMGIADNGADTTFYQGVDVRFSMTGETDNGLSFGATIDLDDAVETAVRGNDTADTGNNELADYTVFISGGFGTLTMGDTDGAFDWAYGEVSFGGSIADDETSHAGYFDGTGLDGSYDGQVLRYEYSFGDFAFAASVELQDNVVTGTGFSFDGDPVFGLGLTYSADLGGVALDLGLGFQTVDGTLTIGTASANVGFDIFGVSAAADFGNGFEAAIAYVDMDGFSGVDSHYGIGLGYSMDALTVGLNYGEFDLTGGGSTDGFGLAIDYDLGGAEIQFGYGDSGAGVDTWSLGVAMSF